MASVSVDIPNIHQMRPCSVALKTLGCKVNAFESEQILSGLEARGYRRAASGDSADLFVINTCTVTVEADRQARQLIRRTIRNNPEARIVVTGCYAETDPEACAKIPGVDLIVGNSSKLRIPELVGELAKAQDAPRLLHENIDTQISMPDQLLEGYEGRTRAFVQVQQGCDQGCTFCIIHTARGPNRSFSAKMVKQQCRKLLENGYKEIVLCGVDIGSYGDDLSDDDCDLSDLIAQILQIEGDFRIRLSSLDPAHISDKLIALMSSDHRFCRHLHLSMQSGSTMILKRMKRRATREVLYNRVEALRRRLPDIVFSADIMVGFPTETEVHFQDTVKAIDELEIAYPHVFSYSPRDGTPASRIPSQVSTENKKIRAKSARDMGLLVWNRVAKQQIGRNERVLIENKTANKGSGMLLGRLSNFYPVLCNKPFKAGTWQNIKITGVHDDRLEGVLHRL